MCVVADTDNKVGRTKIDPRGKISLFVGYSTQHAGDVYRLLNPKTSRVIHSRDVKWIGRKKRNDCPNDCRLVGCRWNCVYCARLVAKGFSQIPGVDFTDNYSPVVNDVTFRDVVARMIIENLKGKVVDIDNTFLNGDLEHEIYMKIPEGYDEVINPRVDKKIV